MAQKREMDNLAKDAAAALAANMSYGKWKAMQGEPVKTEKSIPEGWCICKRCGKPFKPRKYNGRKIYCDVNCQREASNENRKNKPQK